jgi:hypothetical protein
MEVVWATDRGSMSFSCHSLPAGWNSDTMLWAGRVIMDYKVAMVPHIKEYEEKKKPGSLKFWCQICQALIFWSLS